MDLEKRLRRPNYRPAQVGLLLDVSPATVSRMISQGQLAGSKIRGGMRVNKSSLIEFIINAGLEVDPSVLDGGVQ